ncbi:MAG: DNA translocase FtsK 4TM domain-containing protein [Petrimonas sp.]|nr:DNA translocase FtsK 4TM domain-containing protein [Petrimonas sp.]MDD3542479.1 DNA translocase FtsK 4TM domain-containing protein [Petrimonas sp.]
MAKSTKRKRKKTTTATARKRRTAIISFLKNERVRFIFGILVAFLGIFTLLAIISFFFTGAADQSKVLNKSFWELTQDKQLEVDNWTSTGGAFLAETLVNKWFGLFSILIPFFVIYLGLRLMKVSDFSFIKVLLITAFGLVCGSITSAFIFGRLFPKSHINWGGAHGSQIERLLESSIGVPGMILLVLLFILIIVIVFRQSSMHKIQETLINSKPTFNGNKESQPPIELEFDEKEEPEEKKKPGIWRKLFSFKKTDKPETETEPEVLLQNREQTPLPVTQNTVPPIRKKEPANNVFEVFVPKDEIQVAENKPEEKASPLAESDTNEETDPDVEILEDYDPKKDLSSFAFPTMDLLKVYNTGNRQVDMQEQNENKDKIIRTLRNYGIEITSIKATVGPTITLYEIVPQAGVRISRIRNLEDDIALSLSALGIRIIAPMPGKGTIGIEVPNKEPQIVSMQSVIASVKFQECTYDLPVALGKTITNEVFIFDLAKMPHLLVAGATGQGKSVGLNAIITSLLYKKHPSEMKMVLIDPKMVEFNIYSTIEKHYLAKLPDEEKAIITDVTKVTQTLNSLTKEMDDRYELLMRAHVRAIKEYNEKFIKRKLNPKNGHRYLPYIVVVIDEFGDLIMTAGKEIEMPIARIAQKARAVGMHMVIATQRPTTNIITGTIKANFPARMAFRVTSQIDSRTILDATGANQLIGRGDMLFSQGSNLIRIQCAFVDTPEIEDISQYIGKQRGYESAFALPEVVSADSEDKPGAVDLNERDTLFDEAARLIVIHQQGSTSLIQRKFSIGYNRAGRLMDQLETAGIVGPAQGSKPRDVYISDEYSLEKLLDSLR